MSLRRSLAAICAVAVLGFASLTLADGWSLWPSSSAIKPTAQQSTAADSSAGVKKDDSQLTIVDAQDDGSAPIVDTAKKSKKKTTTSAWSKMFHPTQWFKK
jgi:hypothetical protein